MDQWPTRSGAEKQSPLKDTDVPVHQDGAETMNVRNKDEVVSRMEAAVASKQFGQEDILCLLIADACIQVCPKNPVNFNVDNVRVVKLLGGGLHNCSIVRGMVLKTDAIGSIKQVENAKVSSIKKEYDQAQSELNLSHSKMKECDVEISFIVKEQQKLQHKIGDANVERKKLENEIALWNMHPLFKERATFQLLTLSLLAS